MTDTNAPTKDAQKTGNKNRLVPICTVTAITVLAVVLAILGGLGLLSRKQTVASKIYSTTGTTVTPETETVKQTVQIHGYGRLHAVPSRTHKCKDFGDQTPVDMLIAVDIEALLITGDNGHGRKQTVTLYLYPFDKNAKSFFLCGHPKARKACFKWFLEHSGQADGPLQEELTEMQTELEQFIGSIAETAVTHSLSVDCRKMSLLYILQAKVSWQVKLEHLTPLKSASTDALETGEVLKENVLNQIVTTGKRNSPLSMTFIEHAIESVKEAMDSLNRMQGFITESQKSAEQCIDLCNDFVRQLNSANSEVLDFDDEE